jgi:hypothetical protein
MKGASCSLERPEARPEKILNSTMISVPELMVARSIPTLVQLRTHHL